MPDPASPRARATAPVEGLANPRRRGKQLPLDRHVLAFRMKTARPVAASLRAMHLVPQTISGRPRGLSPTGRQLVRFCVVGASGYVVNLTVYACLLAAGLHYAAAATVSFMVAASTNYVFNRHWTFQAKQERLTSQGLRALAVSALSLGANQLCLVALVTVGADHLAGQAVAILLVTPFSFVANKLWAFGAQLDAPHHLGVVGWVGVDVPLHVSSAGKLLLAELGEEERRAWDRRGTARSHHCQDDRGRCGDRERGNARATPGMGGDRGRAPRSVSSPLSAPIRDRTGDPRRDDRHQRAEHASRTEPPQEPAPARPRSAAEAECALSPVGLRPSPAP